MSETKKPRGFAAMTPERRRAVAAMGGASVPAEKRAFSHFSIASKAGKIGGKSVPKEKRTFANKEMASRAGVLGGKAKKKPVEPDES